MRNRSITDVAVDSNSLGDAVMAVAGECEEVSLCDVYRYFLVGFGGGGTL